MVIWAVSIYNRLVQFKNRFKNAFAQIDVQLKRRYDLIPNLVETVKGYAQHEEGVFKEIADARSRLLGAQTPEQTIQAANQQTSALGRLLAIVENYPQLKSNENFRALQDELTGTENRIAVARQDHNDAVNRYNAYIRRFPQVLTAKVIGAKARTYFDETAGADTVPKVNFGR
ncbi:MAG: LemA family protein [Pseudomonadota bacterium]